MIRDEIIKLARKAGFRTGSYTLSNGEGCAFAHPVSFSDCIPELEHFAALVEAAERERIAAEFDRRSVYSDGTPSSGWYEPHEPAEIVRSMK